MTRPRTPRPQRSRPPTSEPLERRRLFASASQLLSYDFAAAAWQQSPGAQSAGVTATLAQGAYGTIDVAGGTTNSGGLQLAVTGAPSAWSSALASGQLAVSNASVTNLGLLTLSFNLWASQAKPVKVTVTSYDAGGNRTGALATTIYPAAASSYQRFALDLSTMSASGAGTFGPTAPKVSFDFEMSSANGWSSAGAQLRLDNVAYSKPAYYVKAGGSNSKDGKSEANAFATPQKALDVSQSGDVILLMNGTYNNVTQNTGAMNFNVGGTPAAWISVKNYPGQSPVIYNEAWSAISIGNGSSTAQATSAAVAYVEVRGLHLQGDSAKVGSRTAPDGVYDPNAANADQYGVYGQYAGISDPRSNGNGISIDGRYDTYKPHDIRLADNWVEDMAGAGIGAGDCDRVQIENNLVQDNCYWDIYATSGISVLSTFSFDGVAGATTRLVRNNVTSGNLHKEIWKSYGNYSDGNGIIIDINFTPASDVAAGKPYLEANGRTLVTNNVSYDNGGSGIHAFNAKRVDIVNNVAYLNSASPYLQYGEIFANYADDVRIYNNILVAPVANTAAGQKAEPVNGNNKSTNVIFNGNVYFGGNTAPVMGTNDIKADPKFVLASVDKAVANFHLQSTSPAINRGTTALAPYLDLDGKLHYAAPDAGAFEFVPSAPTAVTLAAASDTGTAGDGKTRLNNSSSSTRLTFLVAGTLAGATVTLYSDGVAVGSAVAAGAAGATVTASVTTDGATTLADGTHAITATQTFASSPSAASSPALALAVDTAAPLLAAAASRKAHGAAGTFDLPIDLANAASPTVEPRLNGPDTLVLTFDAPVVAADGTLDANDFSLSNATFASASIDGNVVTLRLADVATRARIGVGVTGLADAAGNLVTGGGSFVVRALYGDVNGNGAVNSSDIALVKNASGLAVTLASFLLDLNCNGAVNSSDIAIVKNQSGDVLA